MTNVAPLPAMLEHEPLARYVAWRIGGPARWFATASTPDESAALHRWSWEHGIPVFVLGGGSNILITDDGFPGLVVRNRAQTVSVVERGDRVSCQVGSGAPMAGTARQLAARGYAGLQWAEGLPGTVGGALYGNAGCYGGDVAGILERATVLLPSGEIESWNVERFGYAYRTSVLKQGARAFGPRPLVLTAELRLERADPDVLAAELAAIAAQRKAKTPSGSSCGSSFKNPPGDSAGRLLEVAGCKALRAGGAEVSTKHANYIVNRGGATASDVLSLIEIMRARVYKATGIELEPEVEVVGGPAIEGSRYD